MSPDSIHWADTSGMAHEMRPSSALTPAERRQLDLLHQQVDYALALRTAGLVAPTVDAAVSNMIRGELRILLSDVAEQEIATFDPAEGHALLTQWWAIVDAAV